MNTHLEPNWERVDWFRDNLGLLLVDLENKQPVQVFFDSSDAWDALLGMEGLMKLGCLDKKKFTGKRTLVQCLASAGWLDGVRLLVPHQLELYRLMGADAGARPREKFHENAWQFLWSIAKAGKSSAGSNIANGHDFREEDVENFLNDPHIKDTARFKGLQALRHGTWRERVIAAGKGSGQWLDLRESVAQPETAIGGDGFQCFLGELNKMRKPDRWRNQNIADAAALVMLMTMVDEAKRGGPLPRFFETNTSNLFREVIRNAKMWEHFCIPNELEVEDFVIRAEDYFSFRAVFARAGVRSKLFCDQLRKIHRELRSSDPLRLAKPVKLGILESYPLTTLIDALYDGTFIVDVWRPFVRKADVGSIIAYLELKDQTPDEQLRDVRTEVAKIRRSLVRNVRDYQLALNATNAVQTSADMWLDRRGKAKLPGSYFRHSGLFRFRLPKKTAEEVDGAMKSIEDNGEIGIQQTQRLVVESYTEGSVASLAFVGAFAFYAGEYTLLAEILERKISKPERSALNFIYTASCLRNYPRREKALKSLDQIRRSCRTRLQFSARDEFELASEAVVIAYLCFRALRATDLRVYSQLELDTKKLDIGDDQQPYVDDCLFFSSWAARHLPEDHELWLYAVNNALYYSTELEAYEGEARSRMDQWSDLLFKDRSAFEGTWQYRYFDTYARYRRRVASDLDGEKQRDILESAYREVRTSLEHAPWYDIANALQLRLAQELGKKPEPPITEIMHDDS